MNSALDNSDDPMIGTRIGVWVLEEEIGRGGMGAVYRARRDDGEFRQTVAIKLIKRGMDTDLILKRFRRERQILAALNHSNIAYFLGGGSTQDGLPYFVMEFIEGLPLFRYCDENKLTTAERLRIFRQVCWAVQAAHQIKVIHRDLKPSNILVTKEAKPKLLDFGIAKVFDPELMATEIEPTSTQARVMTPEYASPEQISGEPVTPASDIYSLGVILYELLTGHRPYVLKRHIPHDAERVIREEEPTSLSGSLTRDESLLPTREGESASLEAILASRRASYDELRRELAGDLDKVVMKALRKDPTQRYQSASELSDDITNVLEHRPVNAEFSVTLRSFYPKQVSPEKLSLAVLPLKTLGPPLSGDTGEDFLGIGLADSLISRLSGVPRLVVRPTSSVLSLADIDPLEAGRKLGVDFVLEGTLRRHGGRIRVSVQLLETAESTTRWAKAFDEDLTDVLALEDTISKQVVGLLLPQLTREERLRLDKRGTNKPAAHQAYIRGRYFVNRFTDQHLRKAIDAFNEAIELDPDYALPYVGMADFYTWSAVFGEIPSSVGFPAAQEAAKRALEIDSSLGEAYALLAFSTLAYDWSWSDADYLVRRAIELAPHFPFAHECLSNILASQGRFAEAIEAIRRAEELDPVSPRAIVMTSWTLYQCGHFEEAVEKARKAVEMQEEFPQGLLHLGNALASAGKPAEAVAVLRRSAEMWGKSGLPRYMLCHARAAEGNFEAARTILDKILQTASEQYMKPYFVAMCFVAVNDPDHAFEWFQRAADERNEFMIWFGTEPKLEPMRKDPRYLKLLRQTRNPMADEHLTTSESPNTGGRNKSIAVLPFALIRSQGAEDTEDEYLSIGLADALTMRLSNVRRFIVRPTSSVLPYAGKTDDPFAAGRELGVEFVIDGNIRRYGGRIRVTAQLLEVAENATRWAASFDERFTDVLELEDTISERVTKLLVPRLTGEEERQLAKRGTQKKEAHEAYLQGRYFWNRFTPEAYPKAITSFQRAVSLDPEYALAYVGIADFYTWACIHGIFSPDEGFPKALEAAQRALELDPLMPEAHAAIGLYYSNAQQWADAESSYRRAIELNPNYPLAHEWLSAVLVGTGRAEEGVKEILLAEQLDPMSLRPKVLTAWTVYQARNYDLVLSKARELYKLDPNFMQTHLQLANVLLEKGEVGEALASARRAAELAPDSSLPVYVLCFALKAAGLGDEARKLIDEWEVRSKSQYIAPYFLGMSRSAVGDTDRALEYFQKAQEEKSAWVIWYGTEPKLDTLRGDPRFLEILKRSGNPIIRQFVNSD